MIETWFGPLTKEIFESLLILLCVAVTGNILIGATGKLLGSKGKKKPEVNFEIAIIIIIILPLLEELIFRGPAFVFFDNSVFGWLLVILWGGFFFGAIHAYPTNKDNWEILPNRRYVITIIATTGFTGIILGLLVITTKSLIAAMILHGLLNAYGLYSNLATEKTAKT